MSETFLMLHQIIEKVNLPKHKKTNIPIKNTKNNLLCLRTLSSRFSNDVLPDNRKIDNINNCAQQIKEKVRKIAKIFRHFKLLTRGLIVPKRCYRLKVHFTHFTKDVTEYRVN